MSEKILILSSSPKGKRLADYLSKQKEEVVLEGKTFTLDEMKRLNPFFVVSHGYTKIVKPDIINWLDKRIINTHPALLPVNRGSYANFWSFVYGTAKGATIHRMDAGIDTGDLLLQRELKFDVNNETFYSTYQAVEDTIFNLLTDHWQDLKYGGIQGLKQDETKATYHSLKKFKTIRQFIPFEWTDNIAVFLTKNEKELKAFCEQYRE